MFLKRKTKLDEIIKKIEGKDLLKRYTLLIIGCMLLAVSFNLFFLPYNIVHGGVTGISIVTKRVFNLDPSLFVLIMSLILLTISYFTLGWEKTKGSVAGSIIYPICIKLTAFLPGIIDLSVCDTLLVIVFGSLIAGLGAGINFKTGFSTGGTDIINQIISKYGKVSIGKAMIMSDGLIVLVSGFFLTNNFYAYENTMYGIMVLYIISIITDKVILGISECKTFLIVTEKENDVKNFIMQHLSHGVTVFEAHGGYTGVKERVIMCTIPTKNYFLAKEGILSIDPNAFFTVTDAYEVGGGKVRR